MNSTEFCVHSQRQLRPNMQHAVTTKKSWLHYMVFKLEGFKTLPCFAADPNQMVNKQCKHQTPPRSKIAKESLGGRGYHPSFVFGGGVPPTTFDPAFSKYTSYMHPATMCTNKPRTVLGHLDSWEAQSRKPLTMTHMHITYSALTPVYSNYALSKDRRIDSFPSLIHLLYMGSVAPSGKSSVYSGVTATWLKQ